MPREDAPTPEAARYRLRLYVAGLTPRSLKAIEAVKRACEKHLASRYELEVINIYERPALAKLEQIVAVPTLIKRLPVPLRRIVGDMANTRKLLVGLGLCDARA